jgi:Icc protein
MTMILVQLTDFHIRPLGMAAYRTAETNMLTERALRALGHLKAKPDAIVISGDLTDNGLGTEYQILADMLRRLISLPVYVIPGNHDRREVLKTELAHLPGVTEHPHFVQYAIDDHEVRLVMLDTVIPGSSAGELCADRLAWLDATLAAAPSKPTIVVMHHPPFACGIGHMDGINLRNADEFAAVIAKHKQVRRILCGHHHRPINAQVAHTIASVSPSVAHQVEFTISDDPGFWNLEPAAFQVFTTTANDGIVAHTVYVEDFPGPFPFVLDPDYPGRS